MVAWVIEKDIENYFDAQVKMHGGIQRKLAWIGRRNGMDKFVKFPNKAVVLIEMKKPGAKPRIGQELEIKRLTSFGVDVRVIDTKIGVDKFIQEMIE